MEKIKTLSDDDFLSFWKSADEDDPELGFEAIRVRCHTDLRMFTKIFFPHYCTHAWNQFHEDFFETKRNPYRQARRDWAAPRGSAKSVLATLIDPIHDHCYGLERFILVVSNVDELATQKLKDIRDEILSNGMLKACYRLYFDKKNPGETAFVARRPGHSTFFMARGALAQLRGTRYGPYRPSKIICDDLEHSERVYSERQREKLTGYFFEDVGKVGNEETNIHVVGTILHRSSLLAGLQENPAYESKKYKSIISWPSRSDLWEQWERIYMNLQDSGRLKVSREFYKVNEAEMLKDFSVMWPEKEPPLHLMEERQEIGHKAFMKEKQNEPGGAEDRVFTKIVWYREMGDHIEVEGTGEKIPFRALSEDAYGVLDPATGQNKKPSRSKGNDFACLLTGYQEPRGRVLVHHDWTHRKPPTAQIEEIFNLHEQFKYLKFGVETNLYRNLLMPNILDERKRRETEGKKTLKIPFYDIENTENKDKRIHRMEPKVHHGWMLFNRALSLEFRNQVEDYPNSDHDDCPDALEMLWSLVQGRYKATGIDVSAMAGR